MSRRDPRFIARHRGGLLELAEHRLVAGWAADCMEDYLVDFAPHPTDSRLHDALAVSRSWIGGEARTGACQRASVLCHAIAREAKDPAATAIARATGHAVAVAHFADHCLGPFYYLDKAAAILGQDRRAVAGRQASLLPLPVRTLILSALEAKFPELSSKLPRGQITADDE